MKGKNYESQESSIIDIEAGWRDIESFNIRGIFKHTESPHRHVTATIKSEGIDFVLSSVVSTDQTGHIIGETVYDQTKGALLTIGNMLVHASGRYWSNLPPYLKKQVVCPSGPIEGLRLVTSTWVDVADLSTLPEVNRAYIEMGLTSSRTSIGSAAIPLEEEGALVEITAQAYFSLRGVNPIAAAQSRKV